MLKKELYFNYFKSTTEGEETLWLRVQIYDFFLTLKNYLSILHFMCTFAEIFALLVYL